MIAISWETVAPFNSIFPSCMVLKKRWWTVSFAGVSKLEYSQILYFEGLAHFENFLNENILFFLSTSGEFPKCTENILMHVYLLTFFVYAEPETCIDRRL